MSNCPPFTTIFAVLALSWAAAVACPHGTRDGKPTPPPNLPTFETPTPAPPCSDGWTYNPQSNLCYGVVSTSANEVAFARNLCVSHNAGLPSVSDIASNYAILAYATAGGITAEYLHLGLTYNSTVSGWTWDDGRRATFTNWSSGYPEIPTYTPFTLMQLKDFVVGQWVNTNQYGLGGVLCERRPNY